MALQFILGNSGSGKTYYIHNRILKAADGDPGKKFLVIVPEQFTMQTQRELVRMHPGHSVMNIDILSFQRLAYRVFDELGSFCYQVLEETGKSLILRRVAQEYMDKLTVLKKNMTKIGYISELKSLISELSQYNVTPSQLAEAIEKLPEGSFSYKLKDVQTMYQGFLDYLKGKFVTAEEVLSLLIDVADQSQILQGSVIVFDGFTGFTPIQNRLVQKLMELAEEVYVTVTIDIRENPWHCTGSHELFSMSKKMIKSLQELADEQHIGVKEPIQIAFTEHSRFHGSKMLYFLEQNLFRSQGKSYRFQEQEQDIFISSLKNPREELHYAARQIEKLVRGQGYYYREIAVVCGDLPGYANYAKEVFLEYDIPLFLDQKTTIVYHPFIEFLRAVIEVIRYDFTMESIFRYLRSGLSGIARDDVDILENYCIAAGVRGYRKWSENFSWLPKGYDAEGLVRVNEIRQQVAGQFTSLREALMQKTATVEQQTRALYCFICDRDTERLLKRKEEAYEAAGDLKNAKEYAQIYKIVMNLFDKLVELLGSEVISLEEYARILDAGYEAAKVGIIPPGYDRVVFGDIERTRLNHVRALFFVGVNDGVIPKSGGSDGILSQAEREMLGSMQLELAPTVREKTFIQKFYLYLNLTKPSEKLYLSYARVNGEGKAMRSAYLIHTLLHLYPDLTVNEVDEESFKDRIVTAKSARALLIEGMEQAADQKLDETERRYWAALCRWYENQESWKGETRRLLAAAGFSHKDTPISAAVTKALYGTVLENSVTRLEAFASCAFSHFLTYGLELRERIESGFFAVDIGNIFHEVLEKYAEGLQKKKFSWFTITEEESDELLKEAMEQAAGANHNIALYENARSSYAKERMYRILKRTVSALLYQVRQGRFTPERFEVSFTYADDFQSLNFQLSEEEKMHLRGRIDRIDICEKEDKLYVKIIDYKSGNTSFQFLNVYYGLQLQLVVYMNAALELMERQHPDLSVVPAGIFYYHVNDPMVESDDEMEEELLKAEIFKKLRLNGIVNDDREVLENLDISLEGAGSINSNVIPVGQNKDGSLKKASKTISARDFGALFAYVNETILRLGQRMMQGDISTAPYALAGTTGCDYCEFGAVCQFDPKVPGFGFRRLNELSEEEIKQEFHKETPSGDPSMPYGGYKERS